MELRGKGIVCYLHVPQVREVKDLAVCVALTKMSVAYFID